jgi:hypothetical protein
MKGEENMRKVFCILALAFWVLIPLVGLCEEGKQSDIQLNYMDYIEKGNNIEELTVEEFNILIKQLEKSMKEFRGALSKIRIEDANFTNAVGKNWRIELTATRQQLERAFEYLSYLREHPNEVSTSLQFYIDLMEVTQTAGDFHQIMIYHKKLKDTDTLLSMWNMAFRKAHLQPLAYAKDKNKKLYNLLDTTPPDDAN